MRASLPRNERTASRLDTCLDAACWTRSPVAPQKAHGAAPAWSMTAASHACGWRACDPAQNAVLTTVSSPGTAICPARITRRALDERDIVRRKLHTTHGPAACRQQAVQTDSLLHAVSAPVLSPKAITSAHSADARHYPLLARTHSVTTDYQPRTPPVHRATVTSSIGSKAQVSWTHCIANSNQVSRRETAASAHGPRADGIWCAPKKQILCLD